MLQIDLSNPFVNKAPELLFEKQADGDPTERASWSMTETLSRIKESEGSSKVKLCKETDIYALGMASIL